MGAAIYIQGTSLTVRLPEELDHPASDLIRKETDRIMGQTYIKRPHLWIVPESD